MSINCLFVGAGRRVSLAQKFIENNFRIFSYETTSEVPISSLSTVILGQKWNDSIIYDDILTNISKYNIQLVVPLQDQAVCVLSELKEQCLNKNVYFLTSIKDSTNICFNKKLFAEFILKYFPELYPKPISYPKICKPIFGFSSRDISVIKTETEENTIDNNKFLLQQQIFGTEYSVDCYFDKDCKFVDGVVRERIRVAGGEVITSQTVMIEELYNISKGVGHKLQLTGPVCFQYIIDKNNKPFIIEINARFGGGCVLSIEAGFDMIKLIKHDYFNEPINYEPMSWKQNVLMERFYQESFFYVQK